jgi:hypothetical protein
MIILTCCYLSATGVITGDDGKKQLLGDTFGSQL